MARKSNTIKCRFCGWSTVKFSKTSTPAKAFARLRDHIDSEHGEQSDRLADAAQAERERTDAIIDQHRAVLER